MTHSFLKIAFRISAVVLACLPVAAPSHAQVTMTSQDTPVTWELQWRDVEMRVMTDAQRQEIDRKEENAFKAFYNQKDELDKKFS